MIGLVPQYDAHSYGEYGCTVRVFRRKPDGPFYLEIDRRAKVLKPRVYRQHRAIERAMRAYDRLSRGLDAVRSGEATVGFVIGSYMDHHSPNKSDREQKADKRRAEMWKRVLGEAASATEVRRKDWDAFIGDRRSGRIDARGKHVRAKPRPVSARTVQADCQWLRLVYGWATRWRLRSGAYLLKEDPVRGFDLPKDPDPSRHAATEARYRATMEVAGRYGYLSELLPIAAGTGRRIGSILALRHSDLIREGGTIVAVRWRAEHDKQRRETIVAVNARARSGLDLAVTRRPGVGETWLFPAQRGKGAAERHATKSTASTWLNRAEAAAGLDPLPNTLWHAYRRMWATARKHLPASDVAHAGGWTGPDTLQRIYQRPDEETMQRVVDAGSGFEGTG